MCVCVIICSFTCVYKHDKTLKTCFQNKRDFYISKSLVLNYKLVLQKVIQHTYTCYSNLFNHKQFSWTHLVCFHNSSFRKTAIFDPLTDPAVKTFITVHPATMDWPVQLNPLYRMAQDVKTNDLGEDVSMTICINSISLVLLLCQTMTQSIWSWRRKLRAT